MHKLRLPAEARLKSSSSLRNIGVPNLIASEAPLIELEVTRWRSGEVTKATDKVAEEVPIALIYNGISHAVMLATPQDLEDFALGFSLSEGVLEDKSELYGVEIVKQTQGVELQLEVASEAFAKLKEKRRNLVGRTGCGLCGAESLEQALRLPNLESSLKKVVNSASSTGAACSHISASSILASFHAIHTMQTLQQATGATHACAWVNASGDVQLLREDVGRHNAMDKLIGALAKQRNEPKHTVPETGFVLTSSRASVEMVQKVALAGYNILVAISAPTGLAVRVAEAYGVTLVGFLRDQQFVIYTHSDRIKT
jgi:FdhD protein